MKIDSSQWFWGFGNHEPVSMYQRGGINSTGGVPGNALWLEKWHHFYDSDESAALLEDLGVNVLHCRFYKGMGWDYEKEDFPAVRRFAENCRRHHIKVLAYVQYASLYWEKMQKEVPDLKNWAIVDRNGALREYPGGQYWRWLPCPTSMAFREYTCKILQIAMDAKCFDGVMFDNVGSTSCHCPRCQAAFREYVKTHCDRELWESSLLQIPPECAKGEYHDPLQRAEVLFRAEKLKENFAAFRKYVKDRDPDFLLTGNFAMIPDQPDVKAADPFLLAPELDVVVAQSANEVKLENGCVVTQIPELKLARALHTVSMPLNDSCGAIPDQKPEYLAARLCESLFGGGIPVERAAMRPLRGGEPDRKLIADRKKYVSILKSWAVKYRDLLKLEHYEPVGVLYSRESMLLSRSSAEAMLKVQESLMRNQIPYRVIPADKEGIYGDDWRKCSAVIVPDAKLLSDKAVSELLSFRGRLILTGPEPGDYDENFSQRAANPFPDAERLPLPEHEILSMEYRTRVRWVPDAWKAAFPELPRRELCPECGLDYRQDAEGKIVGVLLTCPKIFTGGRLELPAGEWTAEPFDGPARPVIFRNGMAEIPAFTGACAFRKGSNSHIVQA